MNKRKIARLAGFVGVLGATTVLITTAVTGTGAYFSDAHAGNLHGTAGHLTLALSGDSLNINFTNLFPGVDQTANVGFTPTAGSPNADVWMVFTPDSAAYGAFTGTNHVSYPSTGGTSATTVTGGGLGQYGHFKVVGDTGGAGLSFESYNLQLPTSAPLGQAPFVTSTNTTCNVNANGDGGNSAQHVIGKGYDLPECGVPAAILIGHDIAAGTTGHVAITFGLTGKASAQYQQNEPNVPFKIVATQVGINPSSTNW